jgi:hypothetical protein
MKKYFSVSSFLPVDYSERRHSPQIGFALKGIWSEPEGLKSLVSLLLKVGIKKVSFSWRAPWHSRRFAKQGFDDRPSLIDQDRFFDAVQSLKIQPKFRCLIDKDELVGCLGSRQNDRASYLLDLLRLNHS